MLSQFVRSIFRFRKTTVSIFLLLTYAIIAVLYFWDKTRYTHSLPVHNKHYAALLDESWIHLQNFTHSPHPYTSRENDRVHDYLLNTVKGLTENAEFADVSDDYQEGASSLFKQRDVFNESSTDTKVIYYESSNILVKLNGTDPDMPALLLSAHFDSVPTAYGATDDGMGIATLLGLLSHYLKHRPRRTLIFNFNNNEEFGLLGATAFFSHPWSKLAQYVLNLEGAGAGGKAVLFRTSDTTTATVYQNSVVSQPFGNSIYQQGFYSRYVSSETDYKVYEQRGLRGWDIAFYRPRDLYHTAKDSVQYTSIESLWHMMHTSLQLCDFVASEDIDDQEEERVPAIYFDIIGWKFFAFSAKTLYQMNCALLVIIPLVAVLVQIIAGKRGTYETSSLGTFLRLPCSLALSYVIVTAARHLLFQKNPLVFNRDYFSPTISFATIFALINYLVLSFCEFLWPVQDFKTVALREISAGLWFLLIVLNIRLYQSKYTNTGVYPFTVIYVLVSFGAIVGLICTAFKRVGKVKDETFAYTSDEERSAASINGQHETSVEGDAGVEHDERSPLLHSAQSSQDGYVSESDIGSVVIPDTNEAPKTKIKEFVVATLNYDWSIQFLIVVPLTSFFLFISVDVVLDALDQTCQDGFRSSWSVSTISMLGGMFVILPLIPFTYKLNYVVSVLIMLTCAISFITALLESPFTPSSPLKLRVSQEVDLFSHNGKDADMKVFGRQGGFISSILEDMPSVRQSNIPVICTPNGLGMEQCTYRGMLPNLIDSKHAITFSEVMNVEVLSNNRNSTSRSPYEPIVAELKINVKQNRVCALTFNSTYNQSPLKQVTVFHDSDFDNRTSPKLSIKEGYSQDSKGNDIFRWNSGINALEVHKLNFDQEFYRIGLQWMPKVLNDDSDIVDENILGVEMECYWGEYETDVLVDGSIKRKIPAYDELLEYSPTTVSYANRYRGMVILRDYVAL